MRKATESYINFKSELKDLMNFAVLISYAVPSLKKTIRLTEQKVPLYSIPNPDYFRHDKSTPDTLKEYMKEYKPRLSSYLWISVFSFFEAYIKSVLDELIEFHGGESEFKEIAKRSTRNSMDNTTDQMLNLVQKGKLHKNKRVLGPKQMKYTRELVDLDYTFPTELFSSVGVKYFTNQAKNLKAANIPLLMKDCFNFELDSDLENKFTSYKDKRNNIAHGDYPQLSITDVFDMYKDLLDIAREFDMHLLKYYFVIEKFKNY